MGCGAGVPLLGIGLERGLGPSPEKMNFSLEMACFGEL